KPKEKHQFLTIPPSVDLELLEIIFNEHSYHPHRLVSKQWKSTNIYEQYNISDTCQNKSELARSIQAKKQAEKRRKNKQPLLSSSTSVAKKEKAMALTRKMQLKSL
ncbi:15760_t:CDS:2, partial [Funneliformis geosporum]